MTETGRSTPVTGETLRASGFARADDFVDSLPGAVFQLRAGGEEGLVFGWMSRGLHRIGGFEPDAPLDDFPTFMDRVAPEDRDALRAAIDAVLHSAMPLDHRFRLHAPVGILWLEAHGMSARDGDGVAVCNGFFDDVTARVEAQLALDKHGRTFGEIVDNSRLALLIADSGGGIVHANPQACTLLELDRERCASLADCPASVEVPDGTVLGVDRQLLGEVLVSRAAVDDMRFVLRRTDGSSRILSASASPIRDGAGDVERVVVSLVDVSRGVEAHMRAILEHTPALIYLKDIDGRFLYINPDFGWHYGVSDEWLRGRTVRDLLEPEAATEFEERDRQVLSTLDLIQREIRVPAGDDSAAERIFDALKFPIVDEHGVATALAGIEMDVTGRHEVVRRLSEERKLLDEIVETSVSALLITDRSGGVVHANPRARALLRLDASGVHSIRDLPVRLTGIDGNEVDRSQRPLRRVIDAGATVEDMRFALHWEDGTRQVLSVNGSPVPDEPGASDRIVFSFTDLTRETEARQRVERQYALFQAIFRHSSESMVATDAEGAIRMVNHAFMETFGYGEDEVKGAPIRTLYVDAADHQRVEAARSAASGDGNARAQMAEVQFRAGDGRAFPAEVVTDVLYDADGDHLGFVAFIRDITERRRAREAIERSEERYRTLYHRTPVMLHSIDRDGRLMAVSGYWLEHLGYTEEEMLGRPSTALLTAESARYAREEVLPAFFRTGRCTNVPYQVLRADGSVIDVLLSAVAQYDEHGDIAHSLAVMTDITQQRHAEAEYREIFENTSDGMFRSTPDGRLVRANPALAWLHGFDRPEQLLAALDDAATDWYVDPAARREIRRRLERDGYVEAFEAEVRPLNADNRIWTSESVRATRDAQGRLLYYEGTVRDITADYRSRELVRDRSRVLEMIARDDPLEGILAEIVGIAEQRQQGLTVAVLLLQDGRFRCTAGRAMSDALAKVFDGGTPGELGGAVEEAFDRDREAVVSDNGTRSPGGDPVIDAVGKAGYGAFALMPIHDQQRAVHGLLGAGCRERGGLDRAGIDMLREMAQMTSIAIEQRRLSEELVYQAQYDALTGLPNRVLLWDRLEQDIRDAERMGHEVGVLLLDLDEFKLVNDSLGHSAGDELLQQVAARLHACLRGGDTVARLGGDEFVVVVPLRDGGDFCTDIAERIFRTLQDSVRIADQEIAARPSMGISVYPHDGRSPERLIKAADTAMYAAKQAGRNRYHYFAENMNLRVSDRLRIESELHDAIRDEELVLHFQPRVSLADGVICGAEGLIRWRHPSRGWLLPGEFIEVAERGPLMRDIDRIVIEQAAHQVAALQAAGHRLVISINLSAGELRVDGFAREAADILDRSGVDPAGLEFEITESMLMSDFEGARAQLDELKRRAPGLRVAIDDFGSGYSSLNYLRHLPVDTLKIDRSFIVGLAEGDATAAAIAKTIVELAHNLGMTVVAEGIETVGQLDRLRAFRCGEGQGFLFDRALPIDEFRERLMRPDVYRERAAFDHDTGSP